MTAGSSTPSIGSCSGDAVDVVLVVYGRDRQVDLVLLAVVDPGGHGVGPAGAREGQVVGPVRGDVRQHVARIRAGLGGRHQPVPGGRRVDHVPDRPRLPRARPQRLGLDGHVGGSNLVEAGNGGGKPLDRPVQGPGTCCPARSGAPLSVLSENAKSSWISADHHVHDAGVEVRPGQVGLDRGGRVVRLVLGEDFDRFVAHPASLPHGGERAVDELVQRVVHEAQIEREPGIPGPDPAHLVGSDQVRLPGLGNGRRNQREGSVDDR